MWNANNSLINSSVMDLRRTPPDSEPPKPVEEPPERPQTEPPAPVREPDPTPPDYLGSRVQKVTSLFLVCFGVFLQDIPAQDAVAQGATTITNIEQLPGWQSCDTCSGGGKVPYSMAQGLDYPVLLTTRFSIGHGVPWSHALWWKRLGNNSNISHFEISLDEYIEDPDSSWGIEYNVNQLLDNQWFKFSTQCSFGDGIWQVWDSAHKRWAPTNVPCLRPAPSTHTHLRMDYERVNGRAHFLTITIEKQVYRIDRSFDPQPIAGRSGDFGVHFQLNGNKQSNPYSVWVHDFRLTYW